MKAVSQKSSVTLYWENCNRDRVCDNVGYHSFNVIMTVFIRVDYYKPYNFIKSEVKTLKVLEV